MLFGNVGEDNIMCIGNNYGITGDMFSDIEPIDCALKTRFKSLMSASKMPGYAAFTGYAHAKFI